MDRYQTADGVFVEAHPDDVRAASREMASRMPALLPDPDGEADALAHGVACLEELRRVRAAGLWLRCHARVMAPASRLS